MNQPFNAEDFLLEIEHLNRLINNREKQIQVDSLKVDLNRPRECSDLTSSILN